MKDVKALWLYTHTHTHTHTQYNLINNTKSVKNTFLFGDAKSLGNYKEIIA